mmetsp:Transcript_61113/g.133833  ORF Transcript_61113/g.133833 Transcript_61113/m.133833 type:complete len:310 (+) Transcript_61113:475-1404(+)
MSAVLVDIRLKLLHVADQVFAEVLNLFRSHRNHQDALQNASSPFEPKTLHRGPIERQLGQLGLLGPLGPLDRWTAGLPKPVDLESRRRGVALTLTAGARHQHLHGRVWRRHGRRRRGHWMRPRRRRRRRHWQRLRRAQQPRCSAAGRGEGCHSWRQRHTATHRQQGCRGRRHLCSPQEVLNRLVLFRGGCLELLHFQLLLLQLRLLISQFQAQPLDFIVLSFSHGLRLSAQLSHFTLQRRVTRAKGCHLRLQRPDIACLVLLHTRRFLRANGSSRGLLRAAAAHACLTRQAASGRGSAGDGRGAPPLRP